MPGKRPRHPRPPGGDRKPAGTYREAPRRGGRRLSRERCRPPRTTAVARFAGPAVGAVLFQAGMLWWACAATGILWAVFAFALMPAVARREQAMASPA
ncbi:hypothetical protein Msi02_22460 [Microbispora siamensis]|uniref:Uncharacterized protein n=1 Tax=Microbispora siamensis TaxID=564413 RepID=A0ABQ4GJ17_9ACTN|nr:hypothetical protein Msi02_22460 [Microbispora siamensis]